MELERFDHLVEIANETDADGAPADPLAPLRAWLAELEACVRAVDYARGRRLCAPDMLAFGTVAPFVEGLDAIEAEQWRRVWPTIRDFTIDVAGARGAVAGEQAWVAARWHSRGVRPDGSTFARPGRLTLCLVHRQGRWLATHSHFTLLPTP